MTAIAVVGVVWVEVATMGMVLRWLRVVVVELNRVVGSRIGDSLLGLKYIQN